ncbi:F-box WD repeat-containing 7-like [Brachionus plicatilis]|uniref:F-box WD repeat-containing 7-like n=1 Tax=Brachionus plicatilis TaxID=10195 RepID=A0A3M7PEN1_BRAPC|nr:F-box WD repeat-containing 7-like [Brachionus plicatilis]
MGINELLTRSELKTEKILSYLDARSLAYFGACCSQWRTLSNQNKFWHRLCELNGYLKYDYLLDTDSHPAIPFKTTTTSPVFSPRGLNNLALFWTPSEFILLRQLSRLTKAEFRPLTQIVLGSVIVSGSSDDRLIKIWSIQDMELLNCFKSKTDSINCLKIFRKFFKEEYIVIGGDDGNIKLFDLVNGDLQHTFSYSSNPEHGVEKFIIHDQKIIAVYSDRTRRPKFFYRQELGKLVQIVPKLKEKLTANEKKFLTSQKRFKGPYKS